MYKVHVQTNKTGSYDVESSEAKSCSQLVKNLTKEPLKVNSF